MKCWLDTSNQNEGPILLMGINPDVVEDKSILLCEDVLDEGYTLEMVQRLIYGMSPETLKTFVLDRKIGKQKTIAKVDYLGFDTDGTKWQFGSGMDKDGQGRRLANFIGAVKQNSQAPTS